MENPIEMLKDWAAAEIQKAKLEAEIVALTCVRDAVDGKISELRGETQTVKLRELGK